MWLLLSVECFFQVKLSSRSVEYLSNRLCHFPRLFLDSWLLLFLLSSVFGSTGFCEVLALFIILTNWLSSWAFMIRVRNRRFKRSTVSLFRVSFPSSPFSPVDRTFGIGSPWVFIYFSDISGSSFLFFFVYYIICFFLYLFDCLGLSITFSCIIFIGMFCRQLLLRFLIVVLRCWN